MRKELQDCHFHHEDTDPGNHDYNDDDEWEDKKEGDRIWGIKENKDERVFSQGILGNRNCKKNKRKIEKSASSQKDVREPDSKGNDATLFSLSPWL